MNVLRTLAPAALCVLLLAGCDEKKPAPASHGAEAIKEKDSALGAEDPKLSAALAAAASAPAARRDGPGGNAGAAGPPADGVFAPGAADALMASGAEPKVELGSEGDAPRVTLTGSTSSWKGKAKLTVATRIGASSALPTVDLLVSLGIEAPKKDADAQSKQAILGDVQRSSLAAAQPGELPPEMAKEIANIKGTSLMLVASESGAGLLPAVKLSKDAKTEVTRIAEEAAEALFFLSVPPPPKPVGVGGAWISGTRQRIGGSDVISYRMFKVKSIQGSKVELTLEGRQYAASTEFSALGLPKTTTLQQLESVAKGELVLNVGESLAQQGTLTLQTSAVLLDETKPGSRPFAVQLVGDVSLSR